MRMFQAYMKGMDDVDRINNEPLSRMALCTANYCDREAMIYVLVIFSIILGAASIAAHMEK